MLKREFSRPPMGWNSYDCYNTGVTEAQVLANAEWMKEHLLPLGWEYAVVDIQWYAADSDGMEPRFQYIPFGKHNIDEWSRFLPDPVKFPSSANGAGFKPLADKLHAMGLKFGIHIMRGIPREAAHQHMKVLGAAETADMIADPAHICRWNPDMYGVRTSADGQAYYDSILQLYASWGVDFIKCDDICNTNMYPHDPYSARDEIEMLSRAIDKVDRDIVLSLSPGPAVVEQSWHYDRYATMWRITDDFWDEWRLLKDMFVRCERWQDHVRMGSYPDCDMLPLGHIGRNWGGPERICQLSAEEQQTMMSLWCMFRAPLMLGADMTLLDQDPDTVRLLTNAEVLSLLDEGRKGVQLRRTDDEAVWINCGNGKRYAALFNLSDEDREVSISLCELQAAPGEKRELWSGETVQADETLSCRIPAHGARIFALD